MKYLVTGSSGFIGSNLCQRLLQNPSNIVMGIDNMNHYYDINLKNYRLEKLRQHSNFSFHQINIADKPKLLEAFEQFQPDYVIHLAAQAGVRYSIENPDIYIESNLIGFYNVLEACKTNPIKHLVYASSSSVYGENSKIPYSIEDKVDTPISLYAATKKSDELLAHAYSKLYNIPSTGLRFFTVYGPAGRPDMAYFNFTSKLIHNENIEIFNYGNCKRDFTYIDDIIEGLMRIIPHPPIKKLGKDGLPISPYKLYNIGHGNPVDLLEFITILQEELVAANLLPKNYDFESHKKLVPMQPGDVAITYADTTTLEKDFNYKPSTSLRAGLNKFVNWYKNYYGEKLK